MIDKDNINKVKERLRQLNNSINSKQEKIKLMEESERNTGVKSFLLVDLKKDLARDIREQTQLKAEIKNANKAKNLDYRINKQYNEFVKQFVNDDGTLNEERIDKKINFNNEYIENSNKTISNLEREIAGKQNLLDRINGNNEEASKKLKEDIEKSKKQLEEEKVKLRHAEKNNKTVNDNKNGYQKYKTQIEKLRTIKQNFANDLKEQERIKKDSQKQINKSKRILETINKKLKDEKLLKIIDNNEYNKLLTDKASCEKTINEKTIALNNANRRILSLQSKINKISIAWEALFNNKDWDEINVRVGTEKTKYTRETPEDGIKLTGENKATEKINNNDNEITSKILDDDVLDAEIVQLEDKSLTKKKKFSIKNLWSRFKNFIVSKFSRENNKDENKTENKNEEEVKVENNIDEVEINELGSKIENETEKIINREDDFMERLHISVDKDYANEVKGKMEQEYIEKHKIVPDSNKEDKDELEK